MRVRKRQRESDETVSNEWRGELVMTGPVSLITENYFDWKIGGGGRGVGGDLPGPGFNHRAILYTIYV